MVLGHRRHALGRRPGRHAAAGGAPGAGSRGRPGGVRGGMVGLWGLKIIYVYIEYIYI